MKSNEEIDKDKLIGIVVNLHQVKGEYHTQLAYCCLMQYLGLDCIWPKGFIKKDK